MEIETLHRGPGTSIELIGLLVMKLDHDLRRLPDVDERGRVGATLRDSREDSQPLEGGPRRDDPDVEPTVERRGVREHGNPAHDRADVADEQTARLTLEPD